MAEADQARGTWVDPDASSVRFADYADQWLRARTRIAPRTREIYALQLRLHILPKVSDEIPPLGGITLGGLTPELVRAWYAAVVTHRGPSAAAKAYTRLRQILAQAVDDERLAKNPCRLRGAGVERHPEQRFASIVQLYQLADSVPRRYRALVLTGGLTGLRQGELFALRRSDVDLPQGTVTVRRKRLRLASGEVIEDKPKSEAGLRTVALPAPLVVELEQHLLQFALPGATAYVFTSSRGHPLERNNFRMRVWIPATRVTGLEGLRWHDLRHTAGTLALVPAPRPRRSWPALVTRVRERRWFTSTPALTVTGSSPTDLASWLSRRGFCP